jgi:hypothetical protein
MCTAQLIAANDADGKTFPPLYQKEKPSPALSLVETKFRNCPKRLESKNIQTPLCLKPGVGNLWKSRATFNILGCTAGRVKFL